MGNTTYQLVQDLFDQLYHPCGPKKIWKKNKAKYELQATYQL